LPDSLGEDTWRAVSSPLPDFFGMHGCLDEGIASGNTTGMKVAVSIPDDVFAETESLAKQLKSSRSEIYSRALSEFLRRHTPDRVTETMNQVVAVVGETTDPFTKRAARRMLRRVEW
jgi:hypothetical protein